MYGFISGITQTNEYYGDGTAKCKECDYHFGIVECEET